MIYYAELSFAVWFQEYTILQRFFLASASQLRANTNRPETVNSMKPAGRLEITIAHLEN